jgi:murein DD-endopeptidase MepM/ murein hydrolase activator NlpD
LGDFNWNLGADDAAEVSPNTVQPSSTVQSSSAVQMSPVRADQMHQDAAPQAMSRRELRNRRDAESAVQPHVVQPHVAESPIAESHPQSHAEPSVASAAEPLAEFLQLAETTVEAAAAAFAHPAVGSRRAARSAKAQAAAAGNTEVRTEPARKEREESAREESARKGSVRTESVRPVGHDRPPRKQSIRKVGGRRKFFSKLFSVGTMVGIAAIMVSTSLPANAFYSASGVTSPAKTSSAQSQSMKVASTVAEPAVNRDAYTVSSLLEQLKLKYGNRNFSYTNDINGTIQWPFPVPVPITSGFGPRIAPCGGCSSVHEGIDFTPGRGVAIGAIADGVVSAVVASHAGLGNHVIVDHVINGQLVQSVYGHMLDGSFVVTVGEAVKVTQKLGEVGSTGESTGPHLHFEIHINNVPVDPFAWLKANAN